MMKIWILLFVFVLGCAPSPKTLYQRALVDAKMAEADEIHPLVCLEAHHPDVVWKKDKVAVATWHNLPSLYVTNAHFKTQPQAIWVVSWGEFNRRLKQGDLTCSPLRMAQLFGMRQDDRMTHFSIAWVSPEALFRPAYQTDVRVDKMTLDLNTPDLDYALWFKKQQRQNDYPWTGLGYTYDWADNNTDYGLTEFIIKQGADVEVEETLSTAEFLQKYCKGLD